MNSHIKDCFTHEVDVLEIEVTSIESGDIFHFGKKPEIIYIAYQGVDDQGFPQMRKRIVFHSTEKNRVNKTSKMPNSGICTATISPPKNVVLSSLEKDDTFIVINNRQQSKAPQFPVGIVHRPSHTCKWQIELPLIKKDMSK